MPNGTFYVYVEQMNNGVRTTLSLLRVRDPNGTITANPDAVTLDASQVTSTETRYWVCFQMDEPATTKQPRYNFAWAGGTVRKIRIKKPSLMKGENPSAWTADMSDTSISIPRSATLTSC